MSFPPHVKEALDELCRELVGVESRMSDDGLTREALPGIGEELRAIGTKIRDLMAEEPWPKLMPDEPIAAPVKEYLSPKQSEQCLRLLIQARDGSC